jgi:hypothetical protein
MSAIVTKQSLEQMLEAADTETKGRIIGRALVGLLRRQTAEEQASNETTVNNNVGFAGCDAKSGSITAKYFLSHGRLEQWQIDRWMKPSCGYPRICKYDRQLNEIAQAKAARRAQQPQLELQ